MFASALPVSYTRATASTAEWEPFARLVLRAAYDATLAAAAALARERRARVVVFLTALGGGAFGNPTEWIVDAIRAALAVHADSPLDVRLVHYGAVDPAFGALCTEEAPAGV